MADYRDYASEAAADARKHNETMRTGFRTEYVSSYVTVCSGCGCIVADKSVHRQKCEWVPRVPTTVYVEEGR